MVTTRYAVRFTTTGPNNKVLYHSIGRGADEDPQHAHLFSTEKLAKKHYDQYKKYPQWYKDVDIIPVEVNWPA